MEWEYKEKQGKRRIKIGRGVYETRPVPINCNSNSQTVRTPSKNIIF